MKPVKTDRNAVSRTNNNSILKTTDSKLNNRGLQYSSQETFESISSPRFKIGPTKSRGVSSLSKVDSQKSLNRAFSSFLNPAGPGDYNLPSSFAQKSVISSKRSVPNYTISQKSDIPNIAGLSRHFMARDSPGPVYNPAEIQDRIRFKGVKYSQGKSERFFEESHIKRIKALPPTYQEEILSQAHPYQKVSIGYGKKNLFKTNKEDQTTPGPGIYNNHEVSSFVNQQKSKRANNLGVPTFGNKYDKWEKVIYHGQEAHFYGREGQGPGAYESFQDTISVSASKRAAQVGALFTEDRGLLTLKKTNGPSPVSYQTDAAIRFKKNHGSAVMPSATREIHFAKYNSIHKVLVEKGIM